MTCLPTVWPDGLPWKYTAYAMLVARWLRTYAAGIKQSYYVTLAGTEMADVVVLAAMVPGLVTKIVAYEEKDVRYAFASKRAEQLNNERGLKIEVRADDFFNYQRDTDCQHIFFLDLEGTCAFGNFHKRLGQMFQDSIIREGDLLLVTSYLGRNPGWPHIRSVFEGEFMALGLSESAEMRAYYRAMHPSFTLFKGLSHFRLSHQIKVSCLGRAKYTSRQSPMGLYAYVMSAGQTDFKGFIRDSDTMSFDVSSMQFLDPASF